MEKMKKRAFACVVCLLLAATALTGCQLLPKELGGAPGGERVRETADSYFTWDAADRTYITGLTEKGAELTDIVVPARATKVSMRLFYHYPGPESIAFAGETVEFMADYDWNDRLAESELDVCKLRRVQLPAGMEILPEDALFFCASLEEVVIPETLREVEPYAFLLCVSLKSIDLRQVARIGESAFASASLERLVIPKTMRSLGVEAFVDCDDLTEVVFEEGLESIDGRAFSGCTSLESVRLPASLQTIGPDVFAGCPLTVIEVKEGSAAAEYDVEYFTDSPDAEIVYY